MTKTEKPLTTKVVTGRIRLSYLHAWEPHSSTPEQEPKYSAAILVPKTDTVTVKKIQDAIEAAKEQGKAKWGGKIPSGIKLPLRDGDLEKDDPAYKGHYFFNANSKTKPNIVDVNTNVILDKSEVYSGCYARVSVNFYPFNASSTAKGVAVGLNSIQKLEDGEPFSGRSSAEADFTEPVEDFLT